MPNVVFSNLNDEQNGIVYGVFGNEFFWYSFTAGQYPNGLEQVTEQILAGADPGQQPHAELKRFPLSELTEIRGYEGWTHVDVKHRDAAGKTDEATLYFATMNTFAQARELAGAIGRPSRESEPRSSLIGLLSFPGIVFLACGVILGLIYLAANDLESGKDVPVGGRRALLKAIIAGIASVLGTKGVLIIGGILLLLIFVWVVKNILAWPRDLVFEFR